VNGSRHALSNSRRRKCSVMRRRPAISGVLFLEGRAAVAPAQPPLRPPQKTGIGAGTVPHAAFVAPASHNRDRSTVMTSGSPGGADRHLEDAVDDFGPGHLKALELERHTDTIGHGVSLLRWFGHRRSSESPPPI
jgi:hypothetical protein